MRLKCPSHPVLYRLSEAKKLPKGFHLGVNYSHLPFDLTEKESTFTSMMKDLFLIKCLRCSSSLEGVQVRDHRCQRPTYSGENLARGCCGQELSPSDLVCKDSCRYGAGDVGYVRHRRQQPVL